MNTKRKKNNKPSGRICKSNNKKPVQHAADNPAMPEEDAESATTGKTSFVGDQEKVSPNPYLKDVIFNLVENGDVEAFKKQKQGIQILKDRDNRNWHKWFEGSYLHTAITPCINKTLFKRNEAMIKYLLAEAPGLTTEVNGHGSTPLFLACDQALYPDVVSLLLQANSEVINTESRFHPRKPLLQAIHNIGSTLGQTYEGFDHNHGTRSRSNLKSLEIAKLLIQHGADLEIEDVEGHTLIQSLLHHRYRIIIDSNLKRKQESYKECVSATLELLLQSGVKLTSTSGENAFTFVSHIEDAELLLKYHPTDINTLDKDGYTPLHHQFEFHTYYNDRDKVIQLMIENGAVIEEGTDAIQLARDSMWNHPFSVIEHLLDLNPNYDINKLSKKGQTLLNQYGNDYYSVKKIINLGANLLLETDNNQLWCVRVAVDSKDTKLVEFIVKNGKTLHCLSSDILCIICEHCLVSIDDNIYKEWFQLLKNLLALPEINDLTVCEKSFLQIINLILCKRWETECDKVIEILLCLSKSFNNVRFFDKVHISTLGFYVFQQTLNQGELLVA